MRIAVISWQAFKMVQKKDKKSKKSTWKFNLDLTHPVEDGIFDSGNFVSITLLSLVLSF